MSGSQRRTALPVILLVVGLAASSVYLLGLARYLYFFGDDWEFLLYRPLTGDHAINPLVPHNEHWVTIPLLLYRLVFTAVGLQHYVLYAALPVIALMVTCATMYRVLTRAGVPPWPTVIAVLLLGWMGVGEDTLWAFQITFLGSLMFGALAILAVTTIERPRVMAALAGAATVCSLMCSGIGLPMLLWVGLFTLLLRGLVPALWTTVPPAVVYVAWFVAYGASADHQGLPDASPAEVVAYVWTGVGNIWTVASGITGSGIVIFLVLVGVALLVRTTPTLHALALSGIGATLGGYGVIAFSRAAFGVVQAGSNRYVAVGLLLTLPAFALALTAVTDRLPARRAERTTVAVALTLLLVATGAAGTRAAYKIREPMVHGLEDNLIAGVDLVTSGEPLLRTTLDAEQQPPIDIALLSTPGLRDRLPDRMPDAQTMSNVRAALQTDVSPEPGAMPFATKVTGVGIDGDLDLTDCSVRATNVLPYGYAEIVGGPDGIQVGLVVPGETVQLQLVKGDLVSVPRVLTVAPGQQLYARSAAPDTDLRITFTTTTFGICGPPKE